MTTGKKRMMVPAMPVDKGDSRDGLEAWIEHRIRKTLENLPHPFVRKLAHLRQRVEDIERRMRQLTCRIEEPVSARTGELSDPEQNSPKEPL